MLKLQEYKFRQEYTYYLLQAIKSDQRELFRKDFLNLHPADQMEFFIGLDEAKRRSVYRFLSPGEFGEIFKEMDQAKQKQMIPELGKPYTIEMINHLHSDDAADLLAHLPHHEADYYLDKMEKESADEMGIVTFDDILEIL